MICHIRGKVREQLDLDAGMIEGNHHLKSRKLGNLKTSRAASAFLDVRLSRPSMSFDYEISPLRITWRFASISQIKRVNIKKIKSHIRQFEFILQKIARNGSIDQRK